MLPDDALTFMRDNVVLVGAFPRSGLFWARADQQSEGVYKIVDAQGPGDGHFPIYWCHYNPDKVHMIALQDQATLMFTARMSGCTFARGTAASDGTVIVGHANIHEGTEYAGLREIDRALGKRGLSLEKTLALTNARQDLIMQLQKEKLQEAFGPIGIDRSLDRTNVAYANSTEITTFGVRDGTDWRFYFQARRGNNTGAVKGVYEI